MSVSASDWMKGITLSIMASIIGGASKLAIRKSWLMEEDMEGSSYNQVQDDGGGSDGQDSIASIHSSSPSGGAYPTTVIMASSKKRLSLALRVSGMIGMTFLNPLCCVLAMNYASPSILAPFSGLTLVWIVLLSNSLIGEQPSKTQIMAATFIVLGEVIVAIFGDHMNDEGVTLHDLVSIVYCGAVLLLLLNVRELLLSDIVC